ncbi:MAG: aminopeptidase, partial [Candidatus Pacebacteria bacterium]|nr:aminopeptidase [Candidatus Paceibacterota bacterium]
QEMLKSPNANKIGEFSLTDARMSRITQPMAETLYDENIGGPYGNTHLAVGMAYKDCYRGDASKLTKKDWEKRGFNDAAEHTDIVSTTDRTVVARLVDDSEKMIYQDGKFVV